MKIKELKEVDIWSKNGHRLFKGNVNDIPKWAEDFEIMGSESKSSIMLDVWVTITYNDSGKKVVTITER